jgi:phosphoribosylformimino-5-aminoimidazole carboxamide ribotide isomerase
MQIIPVLDITGGIAVHAQAGDRRHYAPLQSDLVPGQVGDAVATLRAFHTRLGTHTCYVADLDAIQGRAVQQTLLRELAGLHTKGAGAVLVDAGTRRAEDAVEILSCGASEIVVGLETLHSFSDLRNIVEVVGSSQVVFSLDLRRGTPVLHPAMRDLRGEGPDPVNVACRAAENGVPTILVLDLNRVGTGVGVDLGLIESLRARLGGIRLLAGGGVLTRRDLERMCDAGCDGALVGSAIHQSRLTIVDLDVIAQRDPDRPQSAARTSR